MKKYGPRVMAMEDHLKKMGKSSFPPPPSVSSFHFSSHLCLFAVLHLHLHPTAITSILLYPLSTSSCLLASPTFSLSSPLLSLGGDVGLKFNDNRVVLNTLKSHQLVMFAKKFGLVKQNQVIDDVFKSYD